jgi:hypothetical protein
VRPGVIELSGFGTSQTYNGQDVRCAALDLGAALGEYFSSGDIQYTRSHASSFTTLPYNETFGYPHSSFSFTINALDVSIAIAIPP